MHFCFIMIKRRVGCIRPRIFKICRRFFPFGVPKSGRAQILRVTLACAPPVCTGLCPTVCRFAAEPKGEFF